MMKASAEVQGRNPNAYDHPVPAFGLGHATSKSHHLGVFGNLNRRVAKKAHPSSRSYRRGLRLSQPT